MRKGTIAHSRGYEPWAVFILAFVLLSRECPKAGNREIRGREKAYFVIAGRI